MKTSTLSSLSKILLFCVLLPTCAASCGDTANAPVDTEAQTAVSVPAESETAEETVNTVKDDLPERNYNDYAFNIFTRTNTTHYLFVAEEQNADTLNDAIFERNSRISERFNLHFTEKEYTNETDAATLVLAGDDTYSLMNVRCTAANTMAQNRYSYDISQMEYIDLNKPYWDKELTESIAFAGKDYVAIGSSNLTAIDFMTILLYNKNMAEQFDFGDLYQTVWDGKWTFDEYKRMGMAVLSDLNGDGVMNEEDRWGMLGASKFLHISLLHGGDVLMMHKGDDGYPVYDMPTDEKFLNVAYKVFDVLNDSAAWYKTSDATNEATEYHDMFRAGQGLFMTTIFYYLETMRDMKEEFGVLPFPKYDEAQERYRNRLCFFDATVIPVSVHDAECSSIILEALNCESYNSVVPAYYEIALKGKYTRDPESAKMLDMIMANRVLDIGDTYYSGEIRDGFLSNLFITNKRENLVSTAEKRTGTMEKKIADLKDNYESQE